MARRCSRSKASTARRSGYLARTCWADLTDQAQGLRSKTRLLLLQRAYKRHVKRSKRRAANQSFRLWTAGAKCKVWGSAPASSSLKVPQLPSAEELKPVLYRAEPRHAQMGWQTGEQPVSKTCNSTIDDSKLFWRVARGADNKDRVQRGAEHEGLSICL